MRGTNGERNTGTARVSSQGWMLCCSAVTHHLPICQLCLTCDPHHPPSPSGIRAHHLNPLVSFILPSFGPPLVTDEQRKNDRQMNKVADAVWDPETEGEGKANSSLSSALLCSYRLHHICRTTAALRNLVVSDGSTSGKSSVLRKISFLFGRFGDYHAPKLTQSHCIGHCKVSHFPLQCVTFVSWVLINWSVKMFWKENYISR